MADAHANFATSLVATAPSPATTGTSLVVTAAEGARFPAVPFNAVIHPIDAFPTPTNAEIVRVTGIATDTFTITRGVGLAAPDTSSARTVVVGDRIYAGLTAAGLEQYQPLDTDLTAIAALTSAADKVPYATGSGAWAVATFTAAGRALVDDADAAAMRTTLGAAPDTGISGYGVRAFPAAASASASTVTGVANTWYAIRVPFYQSGNVTGVVYRVGATSSGNVRCAIYDLAGAKLADRTTDAAQSAAGVFQQVALDSPYAVTPRMLIALIWFSSATATWMGNRWLGLTATGTNATTTPTTAAAAAVENADRPMLTTY